MPQITRCCFTMQKNYSHTPENCSKQKKIFCCKHCTHTITFKLFLPNKKCCSAFCAVVSKKMILLFCVFCRFCSGKKQLKKVEKQQEQEEKLSGSPTPPLGAVQCAVNREQFQVYRDSAMGNSLVLCSHTLLFLLSSGTPKTTTGRRIFAFAFEDLLTCSGQPAQKCFALSCQMIIYAFT